MIMQEGPVLVPIIKGVNCYLQNILIVSFVF